MKTLSKEARSQWRNVWCILRSLDHYELEEVGVSELPEGWVALDLGWPDFCDNPHRYLLQTDVAQAAIIWRAVEKRMP